MEISYNFFIQNGHAKSFFQRWFALVCDLLIGGLKWPRYLSFCLFERQQSISHCVPKKCPWRVLSLPWSFITRSKCQENKNSFNNCPRHLSKTSNVLPIFVCSKQSFKWLLLPSIHPPTYPPRNIIFDKQVIIQFVALQPISSAAPT